MGRIEIKEEQRTEGEPLKMGPALCLRAHLFFQLVSSIRSRDLAPAALSRSSKSGYNRWLPHLLQAVSLSLINVHCLYDLLENDASKGLFVKSISTMPIPEDASPADGASFEKLWG